MHSKNTTPTPSRPCRRFVRLSQPSRACTRQKPEDRTLRRRAGALRARKTKKKNGCRRILAEEEAASGETGERPDAFLRPAVHFCPQCGQFRGMKMALFCGCQKWNGAVISKKPKKASKIKEHFDAIPISGGFGHENRRTKPSYSLDGRCCMVAGAGTLQK